MAASNTIKNSFGSGSITLSDGTGSPISVVIDFDNADFSVDGLADKLKAIAVYQTRGVVNSVRHTEREFPSGSFSAMMSEFTDASSGTAIDFITGKAPFAARISTLAGGANADVFTCDVKMIAEGTDFGDSADHEIIMEDCAVKVAYSTGDPSSFSFSFTCYGAISGDVTISA